MAEVKLKISGFDFDFMVLGLKVCQIAAVYYTMTFGKQNDGKETFGKQRFGQFNYLHTECSPK